VTQKFWMIGRTALLGAVIMVGYKAATRDQWVLGGDPTARLIGEFLGYALGGALLGAIVGRFLPSQNG
jgi:hypothetical protein